MNSYLALRKANKLRFAMVTETSQKQIQDIVHYLQVTSWDISGVEAIKSDLIDMAIQANKDGKELFTVPEEASSFAVEMKKQCATPNIQNLFFILIWYFLYNAIGYLLLFFVDQEMMAPMDTNYIIGMVIGYQANSVSHEKAPANIHCLTGCLFCSYVPTCLAFEQLCTANCCYQYEFLGMEYSLLGHQCGHISGTSILLRT